MADREKVSGFRLPQETLDSLDELVNKGLIKNRTDGVIKAVQMLHAIEASEKKGHYFQDIIALITKDRRFVNDWPSIPDDVQIHYYGEPGTKFLITKLGPEHVEIVREEDDLRVIATYKEERWEEADEISEDSEDDDKSSSD
ncbi:hypothetical protein [Methanolobus vulcani]|uniref:Uncharacterized protein n=1 Tax=Methanolobus vulcani TaxID=38026 RepID=A0A7Z8KRU2_9EURY|nr:hypothetical protein [Methanolobus vulcani]TQD28269.1 hypothetical protein FKV42_00940 [Methanolobus vulcani]